MAKVKNIKFLKRKQVCQVELDSGEFLFLSMDLVIKFKISKNETINEQTLIQIKKEQRIFDAKRASLNYISYKPRTEKQVRDKLRSLGFSSSEIELCIKFLKEFNYLDDENFTEKYIRDNIKRKALSKKKLSYDLMKKGISRDIIDKFINLLIKDEDDFENAKKKLDKVKYKLKSLNESEQKKYIYQYLLRQGFKSDTIKEVLKDYLITFQ